MLLSNLDLPGVTINTKWIAHARTDRPHTRPAGPDSPFPYSMDFMITESTLIEKTWLELAEVAGCSSAP